MFALLYSVLGVLNQIKINSATSSRFVGWQNNNYDAIYSDVSARHVLHS